MLLRIISKRIKNLYLKELIKKYTANTFNFKSAKLLKLFLINRLSNVMYKLV